MKKLLFLLFGIFSISLVKSQTVKIYPSIITNNQLTILSSKRIAPLTLLSSDDNKVYERRLNTLGTTNITFPVFPSGMYTVQIRLQTTNGITTDMFSGKIEIRQKGDTVKKDIIIDKPIVSNKPDTNVQGQEYPYYYTKGTDTLGVIFSVEQAQKIDNDYQLLSLLKQANVQCDSVNNAFITVVNNLGEQVAQLKVKTSTLEDLTKIKDDAVKNLQNQIEQYKKDQSLTDSIVGKKDQIITNYKKENKKLKTQKTAGFIIGGGALIAVIVLLAIK